MGTKVVAPPTMSALVALFPAVDKVVAPYRNRLDPSASWGVPAHVTVLYPFVPPHAIGAYVEERVQEVADRLHSIEVVFNRVDWFDSEVVYLAPEPDDWFRVATAGIVGAFPDYPPYDGEIEDPTPHLTVGHGGAAADMQRAAKEIAAKLPIRQTVDRLVLLTGAQEPDSWQVTHEFPLGAW